MRPGAGVEGSNANRSHANDPVRWRASHELGLVCRVPVLDDGDGADDKGEIGS
jgi:hypothetical protein